MEPQRQRPVNRGVRHRGGRGMAHKLATDGNVGRQGGNLPGPAARQQTDVGASALRKTNGLLPVGVPMPEPVDKVLIAQS